MSSRSGEQEDAGQLRAQLARKDDQIQRLLSELSEKQSVIGELNSTIELLRVGLGQLNTRPRQQRGIGISAEPTTTTNIHDTKLAFHDKPHRYRTPIMSHLKLARPPVWVRGVH